MDELLFLPDYEVSRSLDFGLSDLEQSFSVKISGQKLSVLGVQDKYILSVAGDQLVIGASGFPVYILKPAPKSQKFKHEEYLPANEHLSMSLAHRAFGLLVAAHGIVKLADGHPAYITKRFDIPEKGRKLPQEDLAALSARTGSEELKYTDSYLVMARSIKKHAGKDQLEPFFRLVTFNFIICNEDAHWRNFSLYRLTPTSPYVLTPAYDLVNTRLHLPHANGYMALEDWLYDGMIDEEPFESLGYPSKLDFIKFGVKIGLSKTRVVAILDEMIDQAKSPLVKELISHSLLSNELKAQYLQLMSDRVKMLAYIPA